MFDFREPRSAADIHLQITRPGLAHVFLRFFGSGVLSAVHLSVPVPA